MDHDKAEAQPEPPRTAAGALLDPSRVRADGTSTMRRAIATVPDLARAWVYLLYLEDSKPFDNPAERWRKIADAEKWIRARVETGALRQFLEDGTLLPAEASAIPAVQRPAFAVSVVDVHDLAIAEGLRWPNMDHTALETHPPERKST